MSGTRRLSDRSWHPCAGCVTRYTQAEGAEAGSKQTLTIIEKESSDLWGHQRESLFLVYAVLWVFSFISW